MGSLFVIAEPQLKTSFASVLDRVPPFEYVAVNAPLAYNRLEDVGSRACDVLARELLHEGETIKRGFEVDPRIAGHARHTVHIDEVHRELTARYQRNRVEYLAELSFFEMNQQRVIEFDVLSERGYELRARLVAEALAGSEHLVERELPGVSPRDLVDVGAGLWTIRRHFRHQALRLPAVSEPDGNGLPMEILR
jgi:predicted RNase H-like nuclease